ncbi:MAG: TM2 domain-containing protein [Burkholderiales bacterium]|nr:TM2 domain-containing protein [Bacteroidia bacterium]
MKGFLIIVFTVLSFHLYSKCRILTVYYLDSASTVISSENILLNDKKPNPVFQLFRKKHKLNKKITAAVLAFPFPFGIVGLHRIYLGTKPYVPVAYIASLGGVFGILPFIDFCAITFDKDFDQYRNNSKVFMWIKE